MKWKEDYQKKNAKSENVVTRFTDEKGETIVDIKKDKANNVIKAATKSIFDKKLKIKKVCKHPIYLQIRFGSEKLDFGEHDVNRQDDNDNNLIQKMRIVESNKPF